MVRGCSAISSSPRSRRLSSAVGMSVEVDSLLKTAKDMFNDGLMTESEFKALQNSLEMRSRSVSPKKKDLSPEKKKMQDPTPEEWLEAYLAESSGGGRFPTERELVDFSGCTMKILQARRVLKIARAKFEGEGKGAGAGVGAGGR